MIRVVIWTDDAFADIDRIAYNIAADNPGAAERVTGRLFDAAAALPSHPFAYRAGRLDGTREAVILPNYLLVYRVGETTIQILRILHASQQFPPA